MGGIHWLKRVIMNLRWVMASMIFFMGVGVPALAESADGNSYTVSGAVNGTINDGRCWLNFNKFGKVWILRLTPKDSSNPAANLFFSPVFGSPAPGEYPIRFSYRDKKATLGASVTNQRDTYSHDTDGTVAFSRFDDRVVGSFSYTTALKDGTSVSAKGSFDCPRGDALR